MSRLQPKFPPSITYEQAKVRRHRGPRSKRGQALAPYKRTAVKPAQTYDERQQILPPRRDARARYTQEVAQIRDRWVRVGHRTPLEVMLRNMEYFDQKVERLLAEIGDWQGPPKDDAERMERLKVMRAVKNVRGIAQACAVDAAPYMHQKLNALDMKAGDGQPFIIQFFRGEELL